MVRRMWALLAALWPRLPVWKRLDVAVFLVMIYSGIVYLVVHETHITLPAFSSLSAVLNTIVLGVLLQFRNRESYDRWWEARRLWGQLVNDSRNLSIKVRHLAGVPNDDRAKLGRAIAGFAVALRNHLRGVGTLQDVPNYSSSSASPTHVPSFIAMEIVGMLQSWRRSGRISDYDLLVLDPHVRAYMDVCGACERIKSTPLPLSYRSLLRHGLVLYMITTPWLVAEELMWAVIPVMAMSAYFLLGIEMTAEDVEEPFGRDGDDLALTVYCDTIRKSAAEILGVGLLPAPASIEFQLPAAGLRGKL